MCTVGSEEQGVGKSGEMVQIYPEEWRPTVHVNAQSCPRTHKCLFIHWVVAVVLSQVGLLVVA